MPHAQTLRIEASKRPHAESLQHELVSFDPQLVQIGRSWQVEIRPRAESRAVLDLFRTLGSWLEREKRSSLTVHFGERAYTLLRPDEAKPDGSAEFLLERIAQLQTALDSRVAIELAKGVLAGRHGIGIDEAFEALRRSARSSRTELQELAQRVADERETPAEIERVLAKS